MISNATIENIVNEIVKGFDPEKIILFGSYARDEANENSDLDLLVIQREKFNKSKSRFKQINRICDLIDKHMVPGDVLVYNIDEFEHWKNSINHVIGRCSREGKILFEK